ncbi:MAG: 2-amino-3,7-dideoxy-D-threo-hept-6-ulosonate synthase [Pyrodictiaceae archaeon]
MEGLIAIGKDIRLSRILRRDGKALILAMDHGLEHGPRDFIDASLDPLNIVGKIIDVIDAVMATPGVIRRLHSVLKHADIALIVKITGKTELRPHDKQLLQSTFFSVDDAIAMGADAIAMTVYWGSPYEDKMLARWREIHQKASRLGLPMLQLAYPRPINKSKTDPEVVAYAARAAAEVGADLIKTYYTGSRESFSYVVKSALGVPVLMSGGPKREKSIDFLKDVEDVIAAGGRGAVVGRNIFNHENPRAMAKAIREVIHDGLSAEEAAKRNGLL